MGLLWRCILKLIRNVFMPVSTLFLFGKMIQDISISSYGALGKISMVSLTKDQNLVHVHQK